MIETYIHTQIPNHQGHQYKFNNNNNNLYSVSPVNKNRVLLKLKQTLG